MSSNPVFGLNALGGSLALSTKKGIDFINKETMTNNIEAGSFDAFTGNFELGVGEENSGLYISAEKAYDGGWRDNSAGDIKRLFINYGLILISSLLSLSHYVSFHLIVILMYHSVYLKPREFLE